MNAPIDLILVKDAQQLLGVSRAKMSELIRRGVIQTYPNELDLREKLVSEAAVLALIPAKKKEAA